MCTQHMVMIGFIHGNSPLGEGGVYKERMGLHPGDTGLLQSPARGDFTAFGMLEADQMIPVAYV